MASIVINEVSQNYTYNIGNNSYAQVALPITSCWGPGFYNPEDSGDTLDRALEDVVWRPFAANREGLEAFIATYRGPSSNYRTFYDYSYQMAMSLLTAGYDVLVCRMCAGTHAQGIFEDLASDGDMFAIKAKYPGTFGNSLQVTLKKVKSPLVSSEYWNAITYIVDASGVKTAAENIVFVLDIQNSTDAIPFVSDVESDYINFASIPNDIDDLTVFSYEGVTIRLSGGSDIIDIPYSERYQAAYDECITKSDELSTTIAALNQANADLQMCVEHIGKLSADISAYETKITAENKKTPIDTKYVQELTSRKSDAEAEKTLWEGDASTPNSSHINKADTEKLISTLNTKKASCESAISTSKQTMLDESLSARGEMLSRSLDYAKLRYGVVDVIGGSAVTVYPEYVSAIKSLDANMLDNAFCMKLVNWEWIYTYVCYIYELLTDKLSYSPNRIISPGWDDQNISEITGQPISRISQISPLHKKLMQVAYYSRCATAYLDIPKCLPRDAVYNESKKQNEIGYAQILSRYEPENADMDVNGSLYTTHSALFAPWGQYRYTGMNKQCEASPSFLTLLIQRAMILNQSNQYEWLLPSNRKHNVRIGKLAYTIPQKLLNVWQKTEGVGVNVISNIPGMGITLWGNSTLFEVPPATYQALANLSTRLLVKAVENVIYKSGICITFQYNNNDAYSAFYAGVTPILDCMKSAGAIEDYYVKMSADINGLDHVNANTVIGVVYLTINGVINDIKVDLIALPPNVDLSQFRS